MMRIVRLLAVARTRVRLATGVKPLSEAYGDDRGGSIFRYYLAQFLQECAADIHGHCLEFQDDTYTTHFGGSRVGKLDILHHVAGNAHATIVADLARPNPIPSHLFDCIVCTHVLHVIFEVEKAVAELHRILKPGGVLLVGVPHLSMVNPSHSEIWRFTPLGLQTLLARVFGPEQALVRGYGNSLTAAGSVKGMAAQDFLRAERDYQDERFAVEVCARAVKKQ